MRKLSNSLLLPAFLVLVLFMISSSLGRDDRRANAPGDASGCEGCHSGGTGSVVGTLTGVPATIIPGTTYSLTLTAGDFGSGIQAGFQITASSGASFPTNVGTFTASTGTRVNATSRLVHSSPQDYSGGIASWTFDWTAPTENTYSEITFFYSINSADGTGGTGSDVTFSGNSSNIPVPISWAYTRIETDNESNTLFWATHMEENTKQFDIEHSVNGRDFLKLSHIKAAGFSREDRHYEFIDERVLSGISYYRIKQIDFDGQFTYSETIKAVNKLDEISIYPTISSGDIYIESTLNNGKIHVYDFNGVRMISKQMENYISIHALKTGIYLLVMEDEFGHITSTQRIVKQ